MCVNSGVGEANCTCVDADRANAVGAGSNSASLNSASGSGDDVSGVQRTSATLKGGGNVESINVETSAGNGVKGMSCASESCTNTEKCGEDVKSEGSNISDDNKDSGYSTNHSGQLKDKVGQQNESVENLTHEESNGDINGRCAQESTNTRLNLDTAPGFLNILLDGKYELVDTSVTMESRPDWLDEEKLTRGRKFAVRYLIGVIYAEMLSLALLLSIRGSLEALIFTGKSHTPLTAFKRYMSTVLRVVSWYKGDMWREKGEAWKNMQVVRAMHASVARRMNSTSPKELESMMTLEGSGIGMLCSEGRAVQKDYEEFVGRAAKNCPFAGIASLSRVDGSKPAVHLNQMELSITQFGFMGLLVLYPEKFGAQGATDSDLEGFIHLWRALGYYLGIKDKYNFCSGNLQETRERCRAILDLWMKPCISEATREWEHMYRCVVEGTSYYVPLNTVSGSLLYLSWVLGVATPRLMAVSSWIEWFLFHVQKITFCYLCRLYLVMAFINGLLRIALWRGHKLSTVWFDSLQKKAKKYDKEDVGVSTRL